MTSSNQNASGYESVPPIPPHRLRPLSHPSANRSSVDFNTHKPLTLPSSRASESLMLFEDPKRASHLLKMRRLTDMCLKRRAMAFWSTFVMAAEMDEFDLDEVVVGDDGKLQTIIGVKFFEGSDFAGEYAASPMHTSYGRLLWENVSDTKGLTYEVSYWGGVDGDPCVAFDSRDGEETFSTADSIGRSELMAMFLENRAKRLIETTESVDPTYMVACLRGWSTRAAISRCNTKRWDPRSMSAGDVAYLNAVRRHNRRVTNPVTEQDLDYIRAIQAGGVSLDKQRRAKLRREAKMTRDTQRRAKLLREAEMGSGSIDVLKPLSTQSVPRYYSVTPFELGAMTPWDKMREFGLPLTLGEADEALEALDPKSLRHKLLVLYTNALERFTADRHTCEFLTDSLKSKGLREMYHDKTHFIASGGTEDERKFALLMTSAAFLQHTGDLKTSREALEHCNDMGKRYEKRMQYIMENRDKTIHEFLNVIHEVGPRIRGIIRKARKQQARRARKKRCRKN